MLICIAYSEQIQKFSFFLRVCPLVSEWHQHLRVRRDDITVMQCYKTGTLYADQYSEDCTPQVPPFLSKMGHRPQ